jgi:hypothetical protein
MFYFDCALSSYELYDTVVALGLTSCLSLLILSHGGLPLVVVMLRV